MKNTTNVFSKGLVTDLHPLSVGQDQLTDALNATFITYNGNELLLQNDMGNTRILDRVTGSLMGLREGFIPLCMREHGGILYIASYNPFTKESELGSIPSPLFSYTQSTPLDQTDHNTSLFKIQEGEIYIQQNPLILSNLLFNVGDGIVCGLNILNGNTSIVRTINEEEKKIFPTISTLNSSGLITLHLLTIPSDTGLCIDLLQHQLSNKQGNIEQWFYDLLTVPDTKNIIQYPNFKSGRLAIKPELQQIQNIQILQNQSTLLPEPYYTQISLNVVLFTYTKYNVKYSFNGDLKTFKTMLELQLDTDAVLPILVSIDGLNQNPLELKSNQIATVSFLNELTFEIAQSADNKLMNRTILVNGQKLTLDGNNLYTLNTSGGAVQIEDIPIIWKLPTNNIISGIPGIHI